MSFLNSTMAILSTGLLKRCRFLAAAALIALPVASAQSATRNLDELTPVDDSRLAEMRGGFSFRGMEISFGIVIETLINGVTLLQTSFNSDSVGGPVVTLNGANADIGDSAGGFQLKAAPNGGYLLTNNGGTKVLHQLGNEGGGLVASISNSLNGQLIQQQAKLNIAIQNLNTIMGLSRIGAMLSRMGTDATGQAPGL